MSKDLRGPCTGTSNLQTSSINNLEQSTIFVVNFVKCFEDFYKTHPFLLPAQLVIVCILKSPKDQVSKFFLVKAMILVELQCSQPCLSSYHILKTPGHEIIKSCNCLWNNVLDWKGSTRIIELQVLSLHRTAPIITPCAQENCRNAA